MRKLKFHEQKLLKKVNFTEWKTTNTTREQTISQKYSLTDRECYNRYNRVVGKIKKLSLCLAKLKDGDTFKEKLGKELINKLYSSGLVKNRKLVDCSKINVSSFCNRRLPVLLKHIGLVQNIKDASRFVEHGHVKFGNLVTRNTELLIPKDMEEFIKWRDDSKIKRKIEEFKEDRDDFKYI